MATFDTLALLHEKGACRRAAAEFRDDGLTPWTLKGSSGMTPNRRFIERYCEGGGPDGGECSVKDECLEFAMQVPHELDFHVWGGMTATERRELRAQRNREAGGYANKRGARASEFALDAWVDLDLRDERDEGVPAEVGLVG